MKKNNNGIWMLVVCIASSVLGAVLLWIAKEPIFPPIYVVPFFVFDCICVAVLSGQYKYKLLAWLCLATAVYGIAVWVQLELITKNRTVSIIIASVITSIRICMAFVTWHNNPFQKQIMQQFGKEA